MSSGAAPTREGDDYPKPFGDKYVLLKHIATGGMADVFMARQTGSAGFVKECVIKRILPHLARDEQFVAMFLDEARLCARLNHPNVAQVYDLGQVGQDYFIAMEYVHGVDLERVMSVVDERGEKYMPPAIAARIVASAAFGLEHAHKAVDAEGKPLGIVHRDVTPSNILVSFEGVTKLVDFGIAKATEKQAKTEVGVVRGKAPYMSPEQIEGEPLDARSDVFSLGAVLYELTTGHKPFDGETVHKIGRRILHDEPSPPTLLRADFPEKLEGIILGSLAKRPADRFSSARVFQIKLEQFLMSLKAPATTHEVAAYIGGRFPKERAMLSLLSKIELAPTDPSHQPGAPPVDNTDTVLDAEAPHPVVMPVPKNPHIPAPTTKVPPLPKPTPRPAQQEVKPEAIGDAIARIRAATNPKLAQVKGPTPTGKQPVATPSKTPITAKHAVTGRPGTGAQLSLGDPVVGEDTPYQAARSNLGGGASGKVVLLAVSGLVLLVGIGLLLLRYHETRKAPAASALVDSGAPAQPIPIPAAGILDGGAPTLPAVMPLPDDGGRPKAAEVKPETPKPGEEPKVTGLPKPAKPAKPKGTHHESTPRALPRLPTPPPAE